MEILISIILLSIIFPFIFKKPNDLNSENNDNIIVFEFYKKIQNTILLCAIFFILFSLFFLIVISSVTKDGIAISIVMAVSALFSMLVYIALRNKKIIYNDKVLHVYNILGKEKVYNVEDITKAVDSELAGMDLYFKDNKKLKIETFMTNYENIKDILDNNGIPYKDKHGNTLPKGW